jgi:hypothetical protein
MSFGRSKSGMTSPFLKLATDAWVLELANPNIFQVISWFTSILSAGDTAMTIFSELAVINVFLSLFLVWTKLICLVIQIAQLRCSIGVL